MIHADFVAENLMVDGDSVRLIDFDDAGFGWHLFELATALYFEMEEEHYPDAYRALIEGYREYRTLPSLYTTFNPIPSSVVSDRFVETNSHPTTVPAPRVN